MFNWVNNNKIPVGVEDKCFIYIVENPKHGKNYSTRIRNNFEEYNTDLKLIKKYGDNLIKPFMVSKNQSFDTYALCEEFVTGKISNLSELENKILELITATDLSK